MMSTASETGSFQRRIKQRYSRRDVQNMKKGFRIKLAAVLAAVCMAAVPCSAQAFGLKKVSEAQNTEDSFYFQSGDVKIEMDAEAAPVIAGLGAVTKPVCEVDSCAYQGKDRLYTYDGMEVSTNQVKGKERIASLLVRGSGLSTPEGLKIGSKEAEIVKLYGSTTPEFGIYRYQKGNAELSIYTTAGVVDEIEYLVIVK